MKPVRQKLKQYFVWHSEYPEEGSVLVRARNIQNARRQGARMLGSLASMIAVRATPLEAIRWQESGQ